MPTSDKPGVAQEGRYTVSRKGRKSMTAGERRRTEGGLQTRTNAACACCREAIDALNGRYCGLLHCYVEHSAKPLCGAPAASSSEQPAYARRNTNM